MKYCELVQQTEYYSIAKLQEKLSQTNAIKRYAYIVHDKDITEEGTAKAVHFHCMIEFNSDSMTFDKISKIFDIESQYIEKAKTKGPKAFREMCKYLVHRNDKNKYQYEMEEITSNFEVSELIEEPNEQEEQQEKEEKMKEFLDDLVKLNDGRESYYNMAVRYGKDFIKNWKSYKEFAEIVHQEQIRESRKEVEENEIF